MANNEPTTAKLLGAYSRELNDEGIDPDTARTLVIEAARQLLRDDPLYVRREPVHAGPFSQEKE